MRFLNTLLCLSLLSFCLSTSAETINIKRVHGEKEELIFSILKLALSKTDSSIKFQQSSEFYNDARLVSEVEANNVDVMWAGASPDIEKALSTIRIPVLKGLLGHRVFIIRNVDKQVFSKISNLDELRRFTAGQGEFWGDTKVLLNAKIPTITTTKYENLFLMLEGERFDYFPRALHEPWTEVKRHSNLNLTVDQNILIIYPFAMYFYVNNSNSELYNKIYNGFEMAINDGSFDELYFNHPMIKDALIRSNVKNRKIIRLENKLMSPKTPYNKKQYWLDVSKL
ncbi:diguanylate cyclase [Vibrio sp. SCSIO 43137]|uniref:diguanylate cyclase n=1 Tax=Vibrio sp. SCSIO 43137 TaxID=3021011 RepID=UPI0023072EC3|nr:diguanylate cyclase [Vibrio sp. SCSIO 43137]WCE30455.1 diguanylate cyclase [Vibrio sp. SCSIO 43137]